MVSYFPRPTRRRIRAYVAGGAALLSLAIVPLAFAEDLEHKREALERDVGAAERELDQSSAELGAAMRRLEAARDRFRTANADLARARGQVVAAQALDDQMRARLDAAVTTLRAARARLAVSRSRIVGQEDRLRAAAVQTYQSGDPGLLALSMVLTSQDPAELTTRLDGVRSVLDKGESGLARLQAANTLLAVHEDEVAAAKARVAREREATADNLERKRLLEAEAERAEARVEALVDDRAEARDGAARARAKDLAELRALEKERARVSELLRRQAERARRRAEQARRDAERAQREARQRSSRRVHRSSGRTDALLQPVYGYVSSPYGMRFHPVYKRWSLHDGTDIAAACGTPIRAAANGRVIARYYNESYGNRVIITHGFARGVALATSYNHMSGYSTYVGERVERGDVIGYVGTTGASTGCHLHLMAFEDGETVDPMGWL